jgi:CheY-like chemotaxis protein
MSTTGPVAPHPEAPFAPLRILVAEDQRIQRAYMVDLVSTDGAVVFEAATAHEAIKLAVQHRPELILLDGLLPGMHGFEVARFVRSIARDYHPRIVVTTAIYKHMRYRNEAKLRYGVDEYLLKPIDEQVLGAIVKSTRSAQVTASEVEE